MKEGEKSRKVGATNMNERRIRIESTNRMEDDDTMILEEEDDGKIMIFNYDLIFFNNTLNGYFKT